MRSMQSSFSYFPDADFDEFDRPLFAFASYNAGRGKIAKMRKLAAKRGLDPNKWFNNVEIVTAEKIGVETTTYVRNIFKYYAAYKLAYEAQAMQRRAREHLTQSESRRDEENVQDEGDIMKPLLKTWALTAVMTALLEDLWHSLAAACRSSGGSGPS